MRKVGNPIEVLYEDGQFIVFDKPAGLLVIPTPKKEKRTLVSIVNEQNDEAHNLHPCHRLDKETSGAIIFAKGKRHQQMMMELFKQKGVSKKYIAFVHGQLNKKSGEIKAAIRSFDQKKYHKMEIAKPALTRYEVINAGMEFSQLEVEPVTGRPNQIRIHFSQIGHPLVGDRKYAFARDYSLKFKRTALHAHRLEWINPVNHKKIQVKSVLPNDMEVFLARNSS